MAKRVTIKQYERIAEDHNRHNSGDNYTWKDVMYEEVMCGHNIKKDLDCMSKKEVFEVLVWSVSALIGGVEDDVLIRIYKYAMASLEAKL